MIELTINGMKIQAEAGQTILDVAGQQNIAIPTLCYHPALEPYGACRLCVVEVRYSGRARIVTACNYEVWAGLEILTDSERVHKSRRITIELLLSRCPADAGLKELAEEYGIDRPRFPDKADDCILCGLCVRICKERMGVGAADFVGRGAEMKIDTPYHRGSAVCLTCGACADVCPCSAIKLEEISRNKPIPQLSEFDMGLRPRSTIYIPFPQALPNVPVIDRENCVHFLTGACKTCEEFCKAGAIDYSQEDEIVDIDVGAAILSPGYCLFDAGKKLELGYAWFPNVLSSLQFERVLSASGPHGGQIVRPSDLKTPKSIAFIQCVGSRDAEHDYCSSVCCMYATKGAIMAKEHERDMECDIFYMDLRAFGKGFDAYYERAKELGVTYRRCRPSSVERDEKTDNLRISYMDENNQLLTKEFGLVVLSSGLCPPESVRKLAEMFGVKTGKDGFALTSRFSPTASSRPGVFVCGPFSEPKDIPETVMEASSASARAMALLSEERGSLVVEKEWPPEMNVAGQAPRIGVFVCHCGKNIGGVANVPSIRDFAAGLPNVVYSTDSLYTCSIDAQALIKQAIEEHNLNRVVVASCTPRTHEPLFRDTVRDAGLNPYLFEMANIRDQCTWVHMHEPDQATEKAKALVRMAVAKSRGLEPLHAIDVPVTSSALVIGGGVAGMTAALNLAEQGFDVNLVEKEKELGGNMRSLRFLDDGEDPAARLKEMIDRVAAQNRITTWLDSSVEAVDGFVGNFRSRISTNGKTSEIEHGAIIIATGAQQYLPTEYMYGTDDRVVTQLELEDRLAGPDFPARRVVMIQCVGSREDDRLYCSRVCCSQAIKNAINIRETHPETEVFVLYRDIRTYGFREALYTRARKLGVRFVRYDVDRKPVVSDRDDRLRVEVEDPVLGRKLQIDCDLVALAPALVPRDDVEKVGRMLKVPLTKENFFLEAHMKLRPVDCSVEGVYLAGLAHAPKNIDETIAQAEAAASRAATVISRDTYTTEAIVSSVDEETCAACGICVSICSYDAAELVTVRGRTFSRINRALCKGCGACAMACPSGAAQQLGFKPRQIADMISAALDI